MTLRSKGIAALWARLHAGHMLLNLRGHDLCLQTCKQRLALCYRQSNAGRRDFFRPLDHPHLVFDGAAWDRLKYQLECPSHSPRLTLPTTLHTLQRRCCMDRAKVEFPPVPSRFTQRCLDGAWSSDVPLLACGLGLPRRPQLQLAGQRSRALEGEVR